MFREIVHKNLSFQLFEIKLTITIIYRITLSLLENHTLDHRDNAEVTQSTLTTNLNDQCLLYFPFFFKAPLFYMNKIKYAHDIVYKFLFL